MRAQSLQVNLLGPCNARCPFCIAKTTWKTGCKDNEALFKHLGRALRFARYHQVDSVMITSTGEPTLIDGMYDVVAKAKHHGFPSIELQTNGMTLADRPEMMGGLETLGLTGIALSVASPDPQKNCDFIGVTHNYLELMEKASHIGFLCRVTLNLVAGEINAEELPDWADLLVSKGVHQLTLRELAIPDFNVFKGSDAVSEWVLRKGMKSPAVRALQAEVSSKGTLVRRNSFGVDVYDYHGLSTAVALRDDTCMSRNTDPNEIRSMILFPDGHIRTSWDLPGSILI